VNDPTAALAAIMARLNRMIGQRATFRTASGVKVTGILSAYEMRQDDNRLWITLRGDDHPIPVVGLADQIEDDPLREIEDR